MLAAHAALCEPLACSLHGLDRAGIQPGMSVAIIGGGTIGQSILQLARLAGATTIVLSTLHQRGRTLAEQHGAMAAIDPQAKDPVTAVSAADGLVPGGVDVAMECAGKLETFEQALRMARRGGTVLVFGVVPEGQTTSIAPYDIFSRELRIVGSYLNPMTHGRAVELVASGRLDMESPITRRVTLEEVPTVIATEPGPMDVKTVMTM